MAPQAGFEPATDRLTADSSTTELLRNIISFINKNMVDKIKKLGGVLLSQGETPTTIGAEELNFRVRHGNGCDLFAIATKPLRVFSQN